MTPPAQALAASIIAGFVIGCGIVVMAAMVMGY